MKKKSNEMFCRMTIVRMAVGLLLAVCPFCTMTAQSEAELEEAIKLLEKLPPAPAHTLYDNAPDAYEKLVKDYERFNIRLDFPESDVKVYGRFGAHIYFNRSMVKRGSFQIFPCGLGIETADACLFVKQNNMGRPWWENSGMPAPDRSEVPFLNFLLEHMRNPDNPQTLKKGFREADYVTVRKDKDLLSASGADSITIVRFPNREAIGTMDFGGEESFQLPDYEHCFGVAFCKAGKFGDLSTLLFLKNKKSLNKYLKYLSRQVEFVEK